MEVRRSWIAAGFKIKLPVPVEVNVDPLLRFSGCAAIRAATCLRTVFRAWAWLGARWAHGQPPLPRKMLNLKQERTKVSEGVGSEYIARVARQGPEGGVVLNGGQEVARNGGQEG